MASTEACHVDIQGNIGSDEMQGQMGSGALLQPEDEPAYDTLDEPVRETLMRDVKAVVDKFCHVLLPRSDTTLLKDWDLWGPLILCVTLALLVRQGAAEDQKTLVFTSVFFIIWVGCVVVTVNAQLLGGT
eukprot:Ihof_evm8s36 gene=Ihof_evmTU8s36